MTIYLRKATASQECPLGQMLSSTDGLTAFTTQIEVTDIHLWKAGATTLAHSSGVSTHISNGVHYLTLDATDTDTAGSLVIYVQPTGCLASRQECIVLNAAVYDAWFSSGFLPVDLVNVHGAALTETTTQLAAGISKFFDVATPTSTMNLITAVTTCTTNTDMRGTDSAALATELAKVPKSDAAVTWNATALASINAEVDTALNTAIPSSNTANSINDVLLDQLTFTVAKQVDVNVIDWAGTAVHTPVVNGVPIVEIHDTSALGVQIGNIHSDLADTFDDVGGVKTVVDLILVDTGKIPKSDAAVTWNSTALASINAEVDTALNTAIPAVNTATSVNDVLLDVLTLAAINAEVDTALNTAIPSSNTANSVNDILLDVTTKAAIVDAVWDEVLHTDHEVASSASVLLQATSTVTEASVVNAVWDEVLHTDHEVASSASVLLQSAGAAGDPWLTPIPGAYGAGTAGLLLGTTIPTDISSILTDTGTTLDALLKRAVGLMHENFRIASPVYSVTGKMTSCSMKIYPTATDCSDDTNVLATYTVTATYDVDDNLATYKVVKV